MMNWEIDVSSFYEKSSKFAKIRFCAQQYELELSKHKIHQLLFQSVSHVW